MRVEFTLQSESELLEIDSLCQHYGITKLNITEKRANPLVPYLLRQISEKYDVCLYVSAKFHRSDAIMYIQESQSYGIQSFLIVSGMPRPKKDSIEVLNELKQENIEGTYSCVFTPYLDGVAQDVERHRLELKLQSGLVSEIYLQIGDNIEKCEREIQWIKSEFPHINIIGSLLAPNPETMFKFRKTKWLGVELSEEYLESLENAQSRTKEIMKLYNKYEIEPVLEMFPFSVEYFHTYAAQYV